MKYKTRQKTVEAVGYAGMDEKRGPLMTECPKWIEDLIQNDELEIYRLDSDNFHWTLCGFVLHGKELNPGEYLVKDGDDVYAMDQSTFEKTFAKGESDDDIAALNESNRNLRAIAREMYEILLMIPSSWEDDKHNTKDYKDRLNKLGVELHPGLIGKETDNSL